MFLTQKSPILIILFSFLLSPFLSFAGKAESEQPINIILNDWTSQIVLSHITAEIFQNIGYKIQFTQKTSSAQWGSLQRGLSHVQVEVWQGTMEKMYDRMIANGGIIDAGTHDALTREEWWYPDYVAELCPGLPDWQALNDCAHIFSTQETSPKGRYLSGPWEKPEAAKIRALNLNFKVIQAKGSNDLWAALAKAKQHKQAIVLFNWTPNWVEAKYKGHFIEFPDYHTDCETNPEWGVNPKFLHDCGNPKKGWLKKVAWQKMPIKWPCAFKTLKNINFDNEQLASLALEVDGHGLTYQQAAKAWLRKNRRLWQNWIPASCQ
jgi:glycine betaine/proline transport system substrate-binding protein